MIVIDSEFQSLIPPLSDDEYDRLEKSLVKNGYQDWREPIITWNGTIIDGHNRYHICDEHGIKFKQMEMQFESREAAKIWIIENQFKRRNLKPYDRSELALRLEPLYAAEAKRRMSEGGGDRKSGSQKSANPISGTARTDEQLAKLAGVSRDTIRKVKVIETEAAKGNQTAIDAREAVKSGEKSINKAYIEVRPKGDKTDMRPICTICGKPIDDGDSYDHDRNKHKSCAVVNTETHRGTRGGRPPKGKFAKAQYAEDGRRICSICGEPINEGEHYHDKLNWHYQCGLEHAMDVQRQYRDADSDLRNNVPTYTIESLKAELLASAEGLKAALKESIAINESMGVQLTSKQKKDLSASVAHVIRTINKI